jgi:tetratricopeptide (TPR) repeat protein
LAQKTGNRRLEGNTLCNLGLQHQLAGRFEEALGRLGASLAVARDLGSRLLERLVLCNLGMVYASLARFDEALDHFEASLVVARESGDQRSEGQFLGYLGLLHARQTRVDAARTCLSVGDALLRAVSDRLSLAILLCGRAETEFLAGDTDAAKAAFAEADAITGDLGVGPQSELGVSIARVRDLLDQTRNR